MRKLNVFYFSGTGNTRFVANYLIEKLASDYKTQLFDVTKRKDFTPQIKEADIVLIAFPIYASSPPIPIRNFVHAHADTFNGKTVAIAETQYFFSGDGAASLGRTLQKLGANVKFAEHFNMPNNLSDNKIFSVHNGEEIQKTIEKAKKRMDLFVDKIKRDIYFCRGFNPVSHAVGYFCQRKWWRKKENEKRLKLRVDPNKCKSCSLCIKNCPVNNLNYFHGVVQGNGKCVFCYRCVNICPNKAITILGNSVFNQYKGITSSD